MDPNFITIIDKVKAIHEAKNHDYATDTNPHSNFEFTEKFIELFGNDMPGWCLPYLALIGTKLARLRELLKGKTPKNESVLDTFIDLNAYTGLWGARYMYITSPKNFYEENPIKFMCANCHSSEFKIPIKRLHPSSAQFPLGRTSYHCSQQCALNYIPID